MNEINDYLFLQPLLAGRIRDSVPGLAFVGGLPDLLDVAADQRPSPAVYVSYLGDGAPGASPAQSTGRGIRMVSQYWSVLLAERKAADPTQEQAAGPLLAKLISSLTEWNPSSMARPLVRTAQQPPAIYRDGIFLYPLVFELPLIFPQSRPNGG